MNSKQILEALHGKLNHNNKTHFLGCFSADEVAQLNLICEDGRHFLFIANVLTSEQIHIMGHWIVFYITTHSIFFFDSFALCPRLYSKHFHNFLNKFKGFTIFKLSSRLQSDDSLVCGAYCIQFVFLCDWLGITKTCKFLGNMYHNNNYKLNDRKVLAYVYKKFRNMPLCRNTFCKKGMLYKDCVSLCSMRADFCCEKKK